MSNNHIREPDDERKVSSSFINNLDNILFARHFQNNHLTQQTIIPRPSDLLTINDDSPTHTTAPRPTTLPISDPLKIYQNSRYPINICNVNIRGFNDPTKQFQFLDHCERNHFDIIGISELHFSSNSITRSKTFTNNSRYDFFWSIEDSNNLTAGGVCLVINKHLSRHIQSYNSFKGRLVYVDLNFKRNVKLRIIQLYNPPRHRKSLSEEIYYKLKSYIVEGQNKQFHVIVMGDFNEHMNEYHDRLTQGLSVQHSKFNFLRLMNKYNLLNTIEQFNSPPFTPTWNNKTQIDGTYMSRFLMGHTVMAMIDQGPTNFPTDHSMVITKLRRDLIFKLNKQRSRRCGKHNQRRIYQFQNMSEEDWKKFKRSSKNIINRDDDLASFTSPDIPNIHTINFLNDKLEECLIKSAKAHIPSKISNKGYRNLKAKPIVIIERFLNKCNRIARSLHQKIIDQSGFPNLTQWQKWIITANKICQEYQINPNTWPTRVDEHTLKSCRKEVNKLNTFLIKLHESQTELIGRRQIAQFFEQRCDDIKNNQSRMIDSILERSHRRIRLDRVLLDDGSLTLDEGKINDKITEHFQNIAGPNTSQTVIPPSWKDDYEPLPFIDDNWYNDQLSHINLEELNTTLSSCPNDKAAGVSTITYEMVRNSSKTFKLKLLELYNMSIDTGLTPQKWKHALLFPIPKPMEWECDINKTRPIVLLEIFRKKFIKIITSRLSKTIVKHGILKGGNHAGLPGGSTFEPIRILDTIRTDAILHKKPLFIYFQDMSKAYDRVRLDILKSAMLRLRIPPKLVNLILSVFTDCTNAIITEFGFSPNYNVLIGIDQGEVISPLLWTIYYDPLLTRLNRNDIGYELSALGRASCRERVK